MVEQPDHFQVANYNLQPLLTVEMNVEIPGNLRKFESFGNFCLEESVMKAELWETNGSEAVTKAFISNDMQPVVNERYTDFLIVFWFFFLKLVVWS